jgi:hypothetical protein
MKTSLLLTACLFLTSLPLHADDKADVKAIAAIFAKIEKEREQWSHLSSRAENQEGGSSSDSHAWESRDEEKLAWVEQNSVDDHGLTQQIYILRDGELLFTLDHQESTPPAENAKNTLTETRYYYRSGKPFHGLHKEGEFASVDAIDASKLKNQPIDPADLAPMDTLYAANLQTAQGILQKLNLANNPDGSGMTSEHLSGEGWRLIKGSRSRDEALGYAWGIAEGKQAEPEIDGEGYQSVPPDADGLANYIVDLYSGQILGKTAGQHSSDLARNSSIEINLETAWSGDYEHLFTAQTSSGRDETFSAHLYQLADDRSSISKPANFLEAVKKAAFAKIKTLPGYQKAQEKNFAITLSDLSLPMRGGFPCLVVSVMGNVDPNGEVDGVFSCTVVLQITAGEAGAAPKLKATSVEAHEL